MRGRIYSANIPFTASTTEDDAAEIIAASTGIIALRRIVLGQTTELGDAAEEILEVSVLRAAGAYTTGSGGTTPTPTPADQEGAASSSSAKVNNTTVAVVGSGTLVTAFTLPWNVRGEFLYIAADGEEIICSPTDAIIVRVSAPADSVTWGGFVTWEELGT